jgi:hypothetical protein
MGSCETCRYYIKSGVDEYVGAIGQCRINPPIYQYKAWNLFPAVKPSAFCGQWKEKN